jgi:hypothetical protein
MAGLKAARATPQGSTLGTWLVPRQRPPPRSRRTGRVDHLEAEGLRQEAASRRASNHHTDQLHGAELKAEPLKGCRSAACPVPRIFTGFVSRSATACRTTSFFPSSFLERAVTASRSSCKCGFRLPRRCRRESKAPHSRKERGALKWKQALGRGGRIPWDGRAGKRWSSFAGRDRFPAPSRRWHSGRLAAQAPERTAGPRIE